MIMSDKYIRISKGLYKQQMINADADIYSKINKEDDFYNSLYFYEKTHYDQYLKTNSASGIVGLKTDRIIYDFDSKSNIEEAKKDAITLCERLESKNLKDYIIYFSGNKGFHVDVLTNQEFTRQEYENILNNTAGDLLTLDKKVTDEQRLFRTPLTKHKVSGLFKIPLTFEELKNTSIEEIKEKARVVDMREETAIKKQGRVTLPTSFTDITVETKKIEPVKATNLTYDSIDFSKMPKYMKPERWALAQGFFEAGERNDALHVLAAFYKSLKYDETECFHLLRSAAEKQHKRTGQEMYSDKEIQSTIIKHIYGPTYKGGIYTVDNSEILKKTVQRCKINVEEKTSGIVRINEVADRFKDYAKKFRENTLKTGVAELDENIMITTGMVVGLLAAPSAGKTTLANNIARNMSKSGDHVVYFSMDMYETLLCARFLQCETGYSVTKIFELIESNTPDAILDKAFKTVNEDLKNMHIDSRSGLTVEEIERTIEMYKETTGVNPRLVVVDYLEKVRGPFTDSTANGGFVVSRLSDIAKKQDVCILLLLQPQKHAGDPSEPLLSMRNIKGASVIEQDCRVVLTVWRPGFSPTNPDLDKYASIAVVKNNMGPLNKFDFHWEGISGKLESMSELDKQEFKDDMKEINTRKAELNSKKEEFNPWG